MDPNEIVQIMRMIAARVLDNEDTETSDSVELAEGFQAIDTWLKGGGFLPSEWNSTSRG